jgi:hypothetical protein
MQTFLPFEDYKASAASLDWQRLGKQRVEAKQIIRALKLGRGWIHHPATKMWAGHEIALAHYAIAVCFEWRRRGYNDSLLPQFQKFAADHPIVHPSWLGNSDFHISHQSNLIRKHPTWYAHQFPGVPSDLPYVWPV